MKEEIKRAREVAINEVNSRIVTKDQAKSNFLNWIDKTSRGMGDAIPVSTRQFWEEVKRQVDELCHHTPDEMINSEQLLAFCEWLSERDFTCDMTNPEDWVDMYLNTKTEVR